MMLDEDIVAVSPSSVYRVLKKSGCIRRSNKKESKKGTGFNQPLSAHNHWHSDISYINICGTYYYLSSLLDGYSRYIVCWQIGERMTTADIQILIMRAKEKYKSVMPRIISDNGPQYISKDFKEFLRIVGMSHVRTSPFYPQSNGKIERWHKSLKNECIRPGVFLSLEDAKRVVSSYVNYYNNERLHSAIGYITPKQKLERKDDEIFKTRKNKLEAAKKAREEEYAM